MKLYFSPKVSIVCGLLIVAMLRLSYWQWERHLAKMLYIESMNSRILEEPQDISNFLKGDSTPPNQIAYRRVLVSGTFDFEHEFILRNRSYNSLPGSFVVTPLKIDSSSFTVLINRGFIPINLIEQKDRKTISRPPHVSLTGLIKESTPPKFLAPSDPPSGLNLPWVDAWLRIDIPAIQKQIPYPLLNFFIEDMGNETTTEAISHILENKSDRDEIFTPQNAVTDKVKNDSLAESPDHYPIPVFDTVIPPGRHLGYVFEWALMALVTLLVGVVLQLRPKRI